MLGGPERGGRVVERRWRTIPGVLRERNTPLFISWQGGREGGVGKGGGRADGPKLEKHASIHFMAGREGGRGAWSQVGENHASFHFMAEGGGEGG